MFSCGSTMPAGICDQSAPFQVIITCMQTAGSFWAYEPQENTTPGKQLRLLEEKMSNIKMKEERAEELSEGQVVAVFNVGMQSWVRAKVMHSTPGNGVTAFLVDYGHCISDIKKVHRLPIWASTLEAQAFQLCLYGMLPIANEFDYTDFKFKMQVCSKWVPAARHKVQDILNRGAPFHFVTMMKWRNVLLGDLFYTCPVSGQNLSLSQMLCNERLGIMEPETFGTGLSERVSKVTFPWSPLLSPTRKPVCVEAKPSTPSPSMAPSEAPKQPYKLLKDYVEEEEVRISKIKKDNQRLKAISKASRQVEDSSQQWTSVGRGQQTQEVMESRSHSRMSVQPNGVFSIQRSSHAEPHKPAPRLDFITEQRVVTQRQSAQTKVQYIPAGSIPKPTQQTPVKNLMSYIRKPNDHTTGELHQQAEIQRKPEIKTENLKSSSRKTLDPTSRIVHCDAKIKSKPYIYEGLANESVSFNEKYKTKLDFLNGIGKNESKLNSGDLNIDAVVKPDITEPCGSTLAPVKVVKAPSGLRIMPMLPSRYIPVDIEPPPSKPDIPLINLEELPVKHNISTPDKQLPKTVSNGQKENLAEIECINPQQSELALVQDKPSTIIPTNYDLLCFPFNSNPADIPGQSVLKIKDEDISFKLEPIVERKSLSPPSELIQLDCDRPLRGFIRKSSSKLLQFATTDTENPKSSCSRDKREPSCHEKVIVEAEAQAISLVHQRAISISHVSEMKTKQQILDLISTDDTRPLLSSQKALVANSDIQQFNSNMKLPITNPDDTITNVFSHKLSLQPGPLPKEGDSEIVQIEANHSSSSLPPYREAAEHSQAANQKDTSKEGSKAEKASLPSTDMPDFSVFPFDNVKPQKISSAKLYTPTLTVQTEHGQASVLAQGKNLVKPLSSLSDTNLHPNVLQALHHLEVRVVTSQQRYLWPAVQRGGNVVAVGPECSGKSLGFLAPLASNVLDPEMYSELNKSNGPLVVVLCPTADKVVATAEMFRYLCAQQGKKWMPPVRIIDIYGGANKSQKEVELLNGCEVLICTPPSLTRIMTKWKNLFSVLNRLCHLVLDVADHLFDQHISTVNMVLDECKHVLSLPWRNCRSVQIIAMACHWSQSVEQFARSVPPDPTIIVSCGLEMLAYCNIAPMIHALPSSLNRGPRAIELVRQQQGFAKTIVVCCTDQEAIKLANLLEHLVPRLLCAHSTMSVFHSNEVHSKWNQSFNPGFAPVLVASDSALAELKLNDAQVLVHFSMPSKKTVFNCRLMNIKSVLPNRFSNSNSQAPEVHVLLDEGDYTQLPSLLVLLKQMKIKIPPNLEAKQQELAQKREKMKYASVPLCPSLRSLGYCLEQASCKFRHVVVDSIDACPEYMPQCGEVRLHIIHVHSPTFFSARLLQHTSPDGKVTSLVTKEQAFLLTKIREYYEDQPVRKPLGQEVAYGSVCAVQSGPTSFSRVRVESLSHSDAMGNPTIAWVFALDDGWRSMYQVQKLLWLPEWMQRPPPLVTEVHLCDLKPLDSDSTWGHSITKQVTKWLIEASHKVNTYMWGKIVLSLRGCMWLEPLECRQDLVKARHTIMHFSLRKNLITKKLVSQNNPHMVHLFDLCRQGGVLLPETKPVVGPRAAVTQKVADWAFMPQDKISFVNITSVNKPNSFFVQMMKFQPMLVKLMDELGTLEQQLISKLTKVPTKPGSFVVAKFSKKCYRAKVEKTLAEGQFLLLFVDYGFYAEVRLQDMLALPTSMLSILPLQAIECSLDGVLPSNTTEWPDSARDRLISMSHSEDGQMIPFAIQVVDQTRSQVTGGWCYSVHLLDAHLYTEEVAASLVLCGEARWEERSDAQLEKRWAAVKDSAQQFLSSDESSSDSSSSSTLTPEQPPFQDMPASKEQTRERDEPLPTAKPPESSHKKVESYPSQSLDDEDFNFSDFSLDDLDSFLDSAPQPKNVGQLVPSSNPASEPAGETRHSTEAAAVSGKVLQVVAAAAAAAGVQPTENLEVPSTMEQGQAEVTPCTAEVGADKSSEASKPRRHGLIQSAFWPSIVWNQDVDWITIKVQLPGVTKYNLKVDIDKIEFLTQCDEKVYSFRKYLFGYVDPQKTIHHARGLEVEIKLSKLADGILWPRLERPLQSKVKSQLDLRAKLPDNSSDCDEDSRNWASAKWQEKNKLGEGCIPKLPHEVVLAGVSDPEDENSDLEIVPTETFDPYDPLP